MEPNTILHFWFTESKPEQWFAHDPHFDATVRERFLDIYGQVARGETASWRATPQGRLAEILVLDQFARNMFRGERQMFACDPLALSLAEQALRAGAHRELSGWQRYFLFLPFMHSESKAAHRKALWLFRWLPVRLWKSWLSYEWAHKKVIDRFGHYPHRNAIVGRVSTPEETEFLKTHPGW